MVLRATREARRKAGLCVQCGRKAYRGYRFCREHRAKHNAAQSRGQRLRQRDRHARGLCAVAGCRRALATSWWCRKHADWYNEWKRRARARGRVR